MILRHSAFSQPTSKCTRTISVVGIISYKLYLEYRRIEGGLAMVNLIWMFFIVVGFVVAAVQGNIELVTAAVFDGAKTGVTVCFGLISVLVFWLGIMRIAEDAGLLQKLAKMLRPAVKF